MNHFRKGQIVTLLDDTCEYGYGNQWKNIPLKIVSISKHYMPAQEFYMRNMPEGFHPGYDDGGIENVNDRAWLYEFIRVDTKEKVDFACYDFELRKFL